MGDVLDAALRCIARWGVAKTTLEDVAREAGSSRATVYRSFPGGKDAVLAALADRELGRLQAAVAAAVAGAGLGSGSGVAGLDLTATDPLPTAVGAGSLEDALVAAITTIARHLEGHAAFQFLLAHEPGLVLPHLAFRELDALLARVRAFGAPLLAPHLGDDLDDAATAAEWVARIVLSYTSCPADGVRLTDAESVRRLVRSFVLPGFLIPA